MAERIVASAPVRADLAGGTLDLWPLGLLVEGSATVNVALSLRAEVVMSRLATKGLRLCSADFNVAYDWSPESAAGALPLVELFCKAYKLAGGWKIETRSGSPAGAGLGGSSALSVALARALGAAVGARESSVDIVARCRDLEAAHLGIPTGVQDFWPAVLGGALVITYLPGGDEIRRLETGLDELGKRMIVAYTGESRISAATNWTIYRRFMDGDGQAREALSNIAKAASEMARALESGDWEKAGEAMAFEMTNRALLAEGILTPVSERMLASAKRAGAYGGKVCGAGGGGCMVFLARREKRASVERAVLQEGGRLLSAEPEPVGCRLEVA